MFTKRTPLLALAAAAVFAGSAISASAAPGNASLLIRHQLRGCHSWSVNGGVFKASQSLRLGRGATLTVTNNDVMSHTLVLTSGPAVHFAPADLKHMGATVTVRLTRPGVYRFTTKPGEDYMAGVKTIGKDNVLTLKVVVS